MRTFTCILVIIGVASAQVDPAADPTATTVEAATAPETAPAAAATATTAAVAPPSAASAAAAAAAGGLANRAGTLGLNLGPAFYGPGLNNANALPPNQAIIQLMQNYLKTAPNAANLRVFVDTNGRMHFTNQFGQETEIVHPVYGDLNELFQDPIELQERLTEFRQQGLDQAIARCQTDLRQRYFNDPASFTPDIFSSLNTAAGGGLGGARAVVA